MIETLLSIGILIIIALVIVFMSNETEINKCEICGEIIHSVIVGP